MDFARIDKDLQANSIIVLVDALNFPQQLADKLIAEMLIQQVKSADLLILNKIDLNPHFQSTEKTLQSLNPKRPIIHAKQANIPIEILLSQELTYQQSENIELQK